jgi:hypothetical protein
MVELCARLVAIPAHPEDDPRSRRACTRLTVRLAQKAAKVVEVYVWPAVLPAWWDHA